MSPIKVIYLMNNQILISQIEAIPSELGEPDCKLTKPFIITKDKTLEPFLSEYTKQNFVEIRSDSILTFVAPTPTLLEKYENLIKE